MSIEGYLLFGGLAAFVIGGVVLWTRYGSRGGTE
jgi:hypothetical protein